MGLAAAQLKIISPPRLIPSRGRAGGQSVFFGEEFIEGVPSPDRLGVSVKVGNVDIGEMEPFIQKRDINGRLVSEKSGPPDPRPAGGRFFWRDDDGATAVEAEIVSVEAVPLRFFCRERRRTFARLFLR